MTHLRDKHVVALGDGRLACRGWRGAPGSKFTWAWVSGLPEALPDYVLTWDTYDGAESFTKMNGGKVKSLREVTRCTT